MNIKIRNMKNRQSIILLISLLLSINLFSQVKKSDSLYLVKDIIKSDDDLIPYSKVLDKEFTKILTGQNTNFGTFASLGTEDDIATIAGHIPIKGRSNIGINITSGVTEGVVAILNGEEVNSNLKLAVQLNLGIYQNTNTILIDATQALNFKYMVDSLKLATLKKRNEIDNERNLLLLSLKKKELAIKQKTKKLKSIRKKNDIDRNNQNSISKDSIDILVMELEIKIGELKRDTSFLKYEASVLNGEMLRRKKQNIEQRKVKAYKKGLDKLVLTGYTLKWFAVSANLNNRSFNRFDLTQDFENQIQKTTFNSFELGINFNKYNLTSEPLGTYYFSFGLSYLYDDNFTDLTKITLTQQQEVSNTPISRKIESTKTVYGGDYEKNISKLKINFNSYWFLGNKGLVAFHFNPIIRSNLKNDTKFDMVAGLLLGFENKEKKNTIINIELFYNMRDVFHESENEDDQFSDRSNLGLLLTFPIYFNQKL